MNKSEQKDINATEPLQCLYEYTRGHRKVYGLCLESVCVHARVCEWLRRDTIWHH